jgi:hypothetical protein
MTTSAASLHCARLVRNEQWAACLGQQLPLPYTCFSAGRLRPATVSPAVALEFAAAPRSFSRASVASPPPQSSWLNFGQCEAVETRLLAMASSSASLRLGVATPDDFEKLASASPPPRRVRQSHPRATPTLHHALHHFSPPTRRSSTYPSAAPHTLGARLADHALY